MSKKKQPNEHIQVFIRCRPLMKSELSLPTPVEVHPELNKILVRDITTDKSTVKSFSFDKVFGSEAKQEDIYNEIVAPVIQEVIFGFNCTIFAYGQTGTGKTFTIEGGRSSNLKDRSEDPLSGIIPRSMKHLFNELIGQDMKFEISVSFLELYNEEIFDLLSNADGLTKLKIFDNSAQKGSVIVQGLQVMQVTCMDDVYAILDKGCKKRRKAATLLNKASSRSHTIFTVTVSIKESSSTLEKVKSGKLNLVDLAGSENIGRSGAIDKRAREAGNINQSLLALGRVITSLCEKAGHIPYRESKLTRLLQDSLGGQTKTAVIATISPSAVHVEETLNTLEYALRAKSITNKPELNTQVTVTSLTQDYLDEIKRLKKCIYDLASDKGLYVTEEYIKHWESTLDSKRKEKFKLLSQIEDLMKEDKSLDDALIKANNVLAEKKSQLEITKARCEEYRVNLEKEKQDQKLHEAMLQAMHPLLDCAHEKLHKDFEEKKAVEQEMMKIKDKLNFAIKQQRNASEMLREIQGKRKQWDEQLHHYSENLMNSIKNTNDSVNHMTSECSNYVNVLKKGLETRTADCENEFGNLFKAVGDLEEVMNTFQLNADTALHEEKSTNLKWIDDFHDAYLTSNETSILHPLNKALSECETSLLSISTSLSDWKHDLTSEMNDRQKLLMEHLDKHKSALESTSDSVNLLLSKHKENIEAYSNLISESLNSESVNKKLWNDRFLQVEQALSSLDTFCTEYIKNKVDTTTQAHSFLKSSSSIGCEITKELTSFCECSTKNIDSVQNQVNFHMGNIFSEKWEGLTTKVDASCSKYKDLNSELAKCSSASKNPDGCCSDIEIFLKNKVKINEQPKVSQCIQELSESISKSGDIYTSFLTENQIQVEESLSRDKMHMENLTESSKELSSRLDSALSGYIRSLETDLLTLTKEADTDMNIEEITLKDNLENTISDLDETITTVNSSEDVTNENECPICTKKISEETLKSDGACSVSIFYSNKPQNSNLKLVQATGEATTSRSLLPLVPKSPINRPRNRQGGSARKNLQFHDVEKLAQQLLENSSGEEE